MISVYLVGERVPRPVSPLCLRSVCDRLLSDNVTRVPVYTTSYQVRNNEFYKIKTLEKKKIKMVLCQKVFKVDENFKPLLYLLCKYIYLRDVFIADYYFVPVFTPILLSLRQLFITVHYVLGRHIATLCMSRLYKVF